MCSSEFEEAKAVIKPLFEEFCKCFDEIRFDKVMEFYHPDAVLIETGKRGVYGKSAIKRELMKFSNLMGKTDMKVVGEDYQKTADYIIYSGEHETSTQRAGVVKGKFLQIWRKVDGKYLLLRDEYSPS